MLPSSDNALEVFRTLFPELPSGEVPAAYENFQRYVRLAIDISQRLSSEELTSVEARGTVATGKVDPISNFTKSG